MSRLRSATWQPFGFGESTLDLSGKQPLVSEGGAELEIYPDRIAVPQVHWASGATTVTGDIEITSLSEPQVAFHYQVDAALREWASWFGLAPLQSGSARVQGEGRFDSTATELSYAGDIAITELLPRTDRLVLEPVSATAGFDGDAQTLNVRDLSAEALGGTLTGEIRVDNLTSAAPRPWLALTLEDFPLEPLVAAIGPLPPEVRNAPWLSTLRGTIEAEGRGLADLAAQANIDFISPATPGPGLLPLEGAVEVDYSGETQHSQHQRSRSHHERRPSAGERLHSRSRPRRPQGAGRSRRHGGPQLLARTIRIRHVPRSHRPHRLGATCRLGYRIS